jgi:mannose-1-phosphate guanylyltransferase
MVQRRGPNFRPLFWASGQLRVKQAPVPKAMILAAGLGTRLKPLTDELPKPLVWVGDRPAAAHIAARLAAAGIEAIVLNTHHRAEAFSPELLAQFPGRIAVVSEPAILGTGGGVANAAPLLGEGDVVVWNGDILAPLDVAALLAAAERATLAAAGQECPAPPMLAICRRAKGEGTIGVDAGGRVVRLRGERFGEEVSGGDFFGVSVLGTDFRRTLPIPGCLVGDGLLPWLRSGRHVATFSVELEWQDIGSVSAYLQANARWLASTGGRAFRGEGATIADGVDVTGSVIGKGARVAGEGRLEGCVLWPGATATAPLANTVVTTQGRRATLTPGNTSPP